MHRMVTKAPTKRQDHLFNKKSRSPQYIASSHHMLLSSSGFSNRDREVSRMCSSSRDIQPCAWPEQKPVGGLRTAMKCNFEALATTTGEYTGHQQRHLRCKGASACQHPNVPHNHHVPLSSRGFSRSDRTRTRSSSRDIHTLSEQKSKRGSKSKTKGAFQSHSTTMRQQQGPLRSMRVSAC